MNFTHLKTFHQIAEKKSFTEAARALFLSQPAVSMQVQSLEHSLGVVLFDRSSRRICLTPEGEVLHAYTKKLFDLVHSIQNEFQYISKKLTGTLNIGATYIMGIYFLPRFIALFHKRYPDVHVNLEVDNSHNIAEKILQGHVELGFAGSSSIHPKLSRHFLHREPLVVVCGKNFYLAQNDFVTANDLVNANFIMRERGTRLENKIATWLKNHAGTESKPVIMTVGSMEATKKLIMNDCGITVLPKHAVEDEVDAEKIIQLHVKEMQLYVDYFLSYVEGKKIGHISQAFIQLLFDSGLPIPEEFG